MDDAGNVNNIIDVGPAPVSSKADESGAAGVAGAAAAVGGGGAAAAAGNKIAGKGHEGQAVEPTSAEKKADPASAIKSTADSDVRSEYWSYERHGHGLLGSAVRRRRKGVIDFGYPIRLFPAS